MSSLPKYFEYRQRAVEAARDVGFEHHALALDSRDPHNHELTTDIFTRKGERPDAPLLLHISGVHGVEGYVGSDVQTAALSELKSENSKSAHIAIIHAANPYGMAWYRRVNQHNIDLNRNFFLSGDARPENADFAAFLSSFAADGTKGFSWTLKQWLTMGLKRGWKRARIAIASGQYQHANALFYGGTEFDPHLDRILKLIREQFCKARFVYAIDVHSGLGDWRGETLLADDPEEHAVEATAKALSGLIDAAVTWPGHDNDIYPATGTFGNAVRYRFADRPVFYVLEEFGTLPDRNVLRTLIYENQGFKRGRINLDLAQEMINCFYPPSEKWRANATSTGLKRFMVLLRSIQK